MRLLINIAEMIHLRVFGHEMTPRMRQFLANLNWSFFGTTISALILFIVNILAGRILGPVEYGKYNLVLTISNMVVIFMIFGLDSTLVKYVSSEERKSKIQQYLSNSLLIILCSSLAIAALGVGFSEFLSSLLKSNSQLVVIGFLFAIIASFKLIFDSFAKGLKQFRLQAASKLAEAFAILVIFVIFAFVLKKVSYMSYMLAASIGALTIVIIYLNSFKKLITRWDKESVTGMIPYAVPVFFSSIVGIILASFDRLFINRYLGTEVLGLYSAYLMSTTVVVSQMIASLGNVFFPEISIIEDKIGLMKKADRFLALLFLPFILAISLLSYIIILMFGSEYPLIPIYILISSLVAFFQLYSMLYSNIVMSSKSMFRKFAKIIYVKPIFIVIVYALMIFMNKINIPVILISLILSSLYDILAARIIVINHTNQR